MSRRPPKHAVENPPEARGVATRMLAEAAVAELTHHPEDMERRRVKAGRTRTELLASAAKIFDEKGYEGASVGDIAAAAGYTKGAVYANFTSKADVFVDLAKDLLSAQAAQPWAPTLVEAEPGPAREKGIAEWLRSIDGQPGGLLCLEFMVYALRHPASREEFVPYYESEFIALAGQIAAARRAATGMTGDPALTEPGDEDRARALIVISLSSIVPLFSGLIGSGWAGPEVVARIIERLLTE